MTARLDSVRMATRMVLTKFAKAQPLTKGRISRVMMLNRPWPEKRAVSMKSRSRSDRAMALACLAGHGQLNRMRMAEMTSTDVLPLRRLPRRMRIGSEGMTMKVSVRRVTARSVRPPLKPATRPTRTPMRVAKNATTMPMMNEFLMDITNCQKVSWPRLVVPR